MIRILGIETSCDETAAAVVENGRKVLSNIVYSQIDLHKMYGGVVPEVASRKHVEKINLVVERAIKNAGVPIDAVAVTVGPGLVGSLLVGVSYAKAYAYALGLPLIPINHLEGHIASNYIAFKELKPPFLALIISGGHSHFYKVLDYNKYQTLGLTRDDALGEAFDKVARMLELDYPGGPNLEILARKGKDIVELPLVLLEKDSLDFSFSGIKSATMKVKDKYKKEDIARSFEELASKIVKEKVKRAIDITGIKDIVIAGGVASNLRIRSYLDSIDANIMYPPIEYCTDNASMIASAAYYKYDSRSFDFLKLNAKARYPL